MPVMAAHVGYRGETHVRHELIENARQGRYPDMAGFM
jgi:hypothetical protein